MVAAAPDLRVPYDLDGTVVGARRVDTGVTTFLSQGSKAGLNDNTNSTYHMVPWATGTWYVIWLFDRPMTITALWAAFTRTGGLFASNISAWGYSTNTTTGLDGTWTYLSGTSSIHVDSVNWAAHGIQKSSVVEPNIRSAPYVFGSPPSGVKGLRIWFSPGTQDDLLFHSAAIYGHPDSMLWLEFWDPVADEPVTVSDVDWGLHDRGTVDTKQLRLKNLHPTLTINGITVGKSDISNDSPKAGDSHALSLDDAVYANSISLGSLAPGAISAPFYVRRSTPANAVLGIYDVRLVPNFTSLST